MSKKNLTTKLKKVNKKQRPIVLPKIPSAWMLTKKTADLLWINRRLFITLTLVYGLLNILLVRGFSGTADVGQLKSELNQAFSGNFGSIATGLGVFVVLLGGSGNTSSATGGAYQFFLGIITSLAVIWLLRQLFAGSKNLKVKDAFYRGMYPLVPFVLVLIVVGLQFLPMLIGSTLYSMVVSNGIAVHAIEKIVWFIIFVLFSMLTFYWISSSLIALYIVTLPDMTPVKALKSAKDLVQTRRLSVSRKLIWLPFVLLIAAAIIMLPIIIWLTPLAQWIFFLLTMFGLVAIHSYMYVLYRELLGE